MKFTRLRLTGFKSFSDTTELVLEPGLSGVVGPNGCGKSNLVEALRWVMGESSYKAMRASGMDDVIFSGSGSRASRNTAEVTLVLDNSDRTAPAPLNTADVLEVTRRIEREAGSVYRINGKEVRARDVQLLFADASTGAHSPALVRQGQIGELIAAKPQQRRALLEEAAGISGLHSRRHEAELRLRAAEQNLERVDDIIAQVEQQLETLKRQARLAIKYRGLSAEIRKAEATLFHLRWVAARFQEKDAEAGQAKLLRELADAQHLELEAQKVLFLAGKSVEPLREAEARAGAALQRVRILAEQLEGEARRAEARQRELAERIRQTEADIARERQLATDSAETIAALIDEAEQLAEEAEEAEGALDTLRDDAETARMAVIAAEAAARAAAASLAEQRAKRSAAERALADARARVAKAEAQLRDATAELDRLAQRMAAEHDLTPLSEVVESAEEQLAESEEAARSAEQATQAANAALEATRPEIQRLETQVSRLEGEAQSLARMLDAGGARRFPAIVDSLDVDKGFEKALGAALGDDLDAATDPRAPIHWAEANISDDPALPDAAEPLAAHVRGNPLLARRLAQIGIVAAEDGPALVPMLRPGQRLVTRDGALWRWDGLVAGADAPTAAAERLRQRNRLAELEVELFDIRAERNRRRADAASLTTALEQSRAGEKAARDRARQASAMLANARQQLERAERARTEIAARHTALAESHARLEQGVEEAAAAEDESLRLLDALGEDAAPSSALARLEAELKASRDRESQVRLALGQAEAASRLRTGRIAQLGSDRIAAERRRDGAASQIATLETRLGEIRAQLGGFDATPESFEARRESLIAEIATASVAHKGAVDALANAESRQREADRAQRLAAEGLGGLRAEAARVEERIKGFIAQRQQIEALVIETLGISASQTAAAAGIRPEHPLPQQSQIETQLDRLKAERERLGGVNLGAEREAEETREKLELMVKDRDDLIAAIGKLRAGIQSLNREGRARLSEAFEKVNTYFQELFTSLFGGGTAELQFVQSEDPLQAGLEIIARPPGKKPSTMTLLSGGEQALTAMSLIFAVFLTNPAPICVLDEVDAPLDDHNVERFCNLLDMMTERTETRFLVITHNPITMARVDRLFGVTMAERGVSQLVSVDLAAAEAAVRQAG
jgi:chromosome segregation protein